MLTAVCCAISVVPASSAVAADDGLQIDPNSPSGTEYKLPLDSERRGAESKDSKSKNRSGSSSPSAFGEGVGGDVTSGSAPQGGGSSGGSSGGGGSDSSSGGKNGKAGGGGSDSAPSTTDGPSGDLRADVRPAVVSGADEASADSGSDQMALIGGIGAGVILLGAAAGFALRRGS